LSSSIFAWNLLGVRTSVLIALENYVACIHGAGIEKAVVPEFNHEKTPAPVHEAIKLHIGLSMHRAGKVLLSLNIFLRQPLTTAG
jgi:hypothetical protein